LKIISLKNPLQIGLCNKADSWQKRPNKSESYWMENTLETIETDSPEYFLLVFLEAWKAKQWGKMTPLLLHNISKHVGKATKEVVNDYKEIELRSYQIKYLEDQTASNTRILTLLEFMKNGMLSSIDLDISLLFADSANGLPELRGEANGQWYVLQLSLSDILFA